MAFEYCRTLAVAQGSNTNPIPLQFLLVPRAPKSLFDALTDTPATASLLARVAASERAARVLAAAVSVPGWNPLQPGNCEQRDRTLLLRAPSSAIAAKLRQLFPSMLTALQRQGTEVIEIRVRVQPEPALPQESHLAERITATGPGGTGVTHRAPVSNAAAQEFANKLALTLRDSPLRDAAKMLSRRLKHAKPTQG